MTVLRIKSSDTAYHQVQDWTGRSFPAAGRYHDVVTETPVRKSIRRNMPAIILAAVLILILCILLSDLTSVYTFSEHTSQLSSAISSLESSNAFLRNELSIALNHPVLRNQAQAATDIEITSTILITAAPAQ